MKTLVREETPDDLFTKDALQIAICRECVHYGPNGSCLAKDPHGCAIFRFVPELREMVHRLGNHKILSYRTLLDAWICAKCPNQKEGGTCWVREKKQCGLDLNGEKVIEGIQEIEWHI